MTFTGEIRGQGDLIVAGSIEGPIAIEGHLTIEASGSVRGEVKARAMVLRGTLAGPAIADESIRLEPGARMVGDARAERVSVVEGAMLRGRITMTGAQPSRRSTAGQIEAPLMSSASSSGGLRSPASYAPVAPRAKSDAFSNEGAPTQKTAQRPPQPIIPGVGKKRVRRKDGGVNA
jgi:cytoskeletal protein CcmA (bactofilin family)